MDGITTYNLRLPRGDRVQTTVIRNEDEAAHSIPAFLDSILTESKKSSYCRPAFVGLEISKTYYKDRSTNNNLDDDDYDFQETEKVSLLTLLHSNNCLIFQLHRFHKIPRSLTALMQLPEVVFCTVGVKRCLESLSRDYSLDVRNAVGFNLSALNADLPFRNFRSGSSALLLGDWNQEELAYEQIMHVTANAFSYWSTARHDNGGTGFYVV